ncbi:ribonuclease H family protein [Pediococcus claussenii]|uniref:Ribonuclease H n=1 Tax=Pediococcus claussenii (strain ATCC BAA-344 / DSM 14800 / JCM 18046 / KCTC 3811 / LMG 21948 / P06) TaxID=701521 RepID=G8PBJ7_PEDCP|nr:ribonuclease H family protein [Pediococcus claussenii]AEV94746.1 RNase H family protein [Pediococcus claussenii ATCC BAA-344]ANZ69942.1 RNase HI [Pediococcus claussenii]ANZ71758.1 RNase HI [Pediococcus claussenii]KRN20925.1 hypothetical protein IV79_GL000150 [Pediococcus claussenii]
MANKFYAVRKGKKTGIFSTWDETQKQVAGFSGAEFKSFKTKSEAQSWLEGTVFKNDARKSESSNLMQTVLYTDGGSRNTGNIKGGHVRSEDFAAWAYLLEGHGKKFSESDGEQGATNNRMEIMALIKGLEAIQTHFSEDEPVLVVSDSKYVLDAINQNWLRGWARNAWKKSDGNTVANKELWQKVWKQLQNFKHLEFKWTKGHASNEGNVFVDELLNKTMDQMVDNTKAQSNSEKTRKIDKEIPPAKSNIDKSVNDLSKSFRQMGLFKH